MVYLLYFFQQKWFIRCDVISIVLRILNEHILLHKFNYTYVVHVPKCDIPETISHLCQISLCNAIVRIASKCVANNLNLMLDSIVSKSQSAFIPGRLITDDILSAFKLNHHLKTLSGRT